MRKIIDYLLMLLGLLVLLCLMFLGYRNSAVVPVDLIVAADQFRLSTVIAVTLACGFLLGMFITVYLLSKRKLAKAMARRKAAANTAVSSSGTSLALTKVNPE